MSGALALDEFLESQPKRVHKSHRKLARVVREAYPIGVPALIMKSSTDGWERLQDTLSTSELRMTSSEELLPG